MKKFLVFLLLGMLLFPMLSAMTDCWEIEKNECCYISFTQCPPGYYEEYYDCEADLDRIINAPVEEKNYLQKTIEKIFETYEPNNLMETLYGLENFQLAFYIILIVVVVSTIKVGIREG